MAYEAKVFRVLIASPSDVIDERDIAVKTIQEWNDLNSPERRIVMLPLRWETHSAPEYGTRPQEVINRLVVDHCDLVIGIFWTRVGTPTGVADSGTLEEIERVANQDKPVMLYFSQIRQDPNNIDIAQLAKLRDFRQKVMPKALVESYSSQIEFRDKLAKQLEIQLRSLVAGETTGEPEDGKLTRSSDITLEFCDGQTGQPLGKELSLSATYLNVSGLEGVPDYASPSEEEETSSSSNVRTYLLSRRNRDYYREYVDYFVKTAMLRSAGFALTNNGVLGARDVFIDLRITTSIPDLTIGTNTKLKVVKPETDKDSSFSISFDDAFSGIAGDSLQVEKSTDGWIASVEARALQPKRVVKSRHKLVIGAKSSGKILIDAKIFADILPEPVTQRLEISLEVNVVEVPALELLRQNEILLPESAQGSRRRRVILKKPTGDSQESVGAA
jgi:hypothetical protein